MWCPKCDNSPLKMTHVYATENNFKTCSAVCKTCKGRFTIAAVIVGEATKRGEGAQDLAKKLEKGKKAIKIETL